MPCIMRFLQVDPVPGGLGAQAKRPSATSALPIGTGHLLGPLLTHRPQVSGDPAAGTASAHVPHRATVPPGRRVPAPSPATRSTSTPSNRTAPVTGQTHHRPHHTHTVPLGLHPPVSLIDTEPYKEDCEDSNKQTASHGHPEPLLKATGQHKV